MRFEVVLNLVWMALGAIAIAGTIHASIRSTSNKLKGAPAWLHIVGVALIVAALFPYISATDDILRIEHLSAQKHSQSPTKKSSDDLIRLYETIDTPLVSPAPVLRSTLLFVSFIVVPVARLVSHFAAAEGGRSPPVPA